jgi:hypothetical protein
MRGELGLEPLDEGASRDERGRFASAGGDVGADMNRVIRRARPHDRHRYGRGA